MSCTGTAPFTATCTRFNGWRSRSPPGRTKNRRGLIPDVGRPPPRATSTSLWEPQDDFRTALRDEAVGSGPGALALVLGLIPRTPMTVPALVNQLTPPDTATSLRLNVGCGPVQPDGWINIDNSL